MLVFHRLFRFLFLPFFILKWTSISFLPASFHTQHFHTQPNTLTHTQTDCFPTTTARKTVWFVGPPVVLKYKYPRTYDRSGARSMQLNREFRTNSLLISVSLTFSFKGHIGWECWGGVLMSSISYSFRFFWFYFFCAKLCFPRWCCYCCCCWRYGLYPFVRECW